MYKRILLNKIMMVMMMMMMIIIIIIIIITIIIITCETFVSRNPWLTYEPHSVGN